MDVNIVPHAEGCLIDLKAQPGARKNEFRGIQHGALKVCVTEVAENGRANKAILTFLRKAWGVKNAQLEIISGATASQKKLLVRDHSPQKMLQVLRACGVLD